MRVKQISASELLRVPHSLQGTKAITLKYCARLTEQFKHQSFEMRSLHQFQPVLEYSKLKSAKGSPPPLLYKTERDTFASFRSSIKRLLSSERHYQRVVFPVIGLGWWLRFSTITARFCTETSIGGSLFVVAMSMK